VKKRFIFLLACYFLCLPFYSNANQRLTIIVSQGHAPQIANAVEQLHKSLPKLIINARTGQQVLEMEELKINELLEKSDFILGVGLFGPVVNVLSSKIKNKPNKLFFSSDHQLIFSSTTNNKPIFDSYQKVSELTKLNPKGEFHHWLASTIKRYPQQLEWLNARAYWQAGGQENITHLLTWAASFMGEVLTVTQPRAQSSTRWINDGNITGEFPKNLIHHKKIIVILDSQNGDRRQNKAVSASICKQANKQNLGCIVGLSSWGKPAQKLVEMLSQIKPQLAGIVMLQNFVVGGGESRESVTKIFIELNVPILKAIKSTDRNAFERRVSMDGIASEKVYYQVAMPELQGVSQPLVIATLGEQNIHELSGIRLSALDIDLETISLLVSRLNRWVNLQKKSNIEKKVAIVYYNHPPGRHNIGADNLDIPASLWLLLNKLKDQGYSVGKLPNSQQELLDLLQEKGVNLPNNHDQLTNMKNKIVNMTVNEYSKYFKSLPTNIQKEMSQGPFGYLHEELKIAVGEDKLDYANKKLAHSVNEIQHLLEGIGHPARDRAIKLLIKLNHYYIELINGSETNWKKPEKYIAALVKTGIEGLQGWGKIPGTVMVIDNEILIPGIQFGNVFIGPQPPRGWEINEELLHANLVFPPPHQYLGFYHYLKSIFNADAIIHLGRHSTYEFLPRRSVGVMADDYSRLIAGEIPGLYPYIVDGVGEGIQAKRRGLAVMIDHLTPPLASTPLYDQLLQLRQLIESYEANYDDDQAALKINLVKKIREKVKTLELTDELEKSMSSELAIMGIEFEEVNDEMLVHEVGHYLTNLQERFMPLGLHVFAKPWNTDAINMMLTSMAPETEFEKDKLRLLLQQSPPAELSALINGLNGGFIAPGPGNDPIRTPDSLPTGRNFFALDSSLIPSPTAWELGERMASDAKKNNPQSKQKSEAIVLWASDVVRDEGVMIAFGLDMLGVKPIWNSRGLVKGLELKPLSESEVRRNTVFTSSGLFRDLYAKQMMLINEAVLLSIAASGQTIIKDYPALTLSLSAALSSLDKSILGSETLVKNQVAAHWVKQTRALISTNTDKESAGIMASMRVFGAGPGSYGAGINRLVERSGSWQERSELARVYMQRMGHSYTLNEFGIAMNSVFKTNLSTIENSYLGRSSNLYGLMDNNDAFDYFGGLSLAVETLTGSAPNNYVINHANADRIQTQPLSVALKQELRGRFLNPVWLKGLMKHDYAGARTMGSEFLEYLWGWQVTNPTLVGDWVWQEVKSVYLDDRYELGLDEFLLQGHNVHVKSNMLAIMLVAIQKGFWNADKKIQIQLAQEFSEIVKQHGLPGSGHTAPDHPMLPWLEDKLTEDQWQAISEVIESKKSIGKKLHVVSEISLDEISMQQEASIDFNQADQKSENTQSASENTLWLQGAVYFMLTLFVFGFLRNRRLGK
jgi:cobaltochelatase CobN